MLYDLFAKCRLEDCIKASTCFNWHKFEKMTELMQYITDMDLELINLIDHDTTRIFSHKIPLVFKDSDAEISEDDYHSDFMWKANFVPNND